MCEIRGGFKYDPEFYSQNQTILVMGYQEGVHNVIVTSVVFI
jgi:hypothetical protein